MIHNRYTLVALNAKRPNPGEEVRNNTYYYGNDISSLEGRSEKLSVRAIRAL